MSAVKFLLEADEAKAVASFLKVVDSQKKTESQFKRSVVAANKYTAALSRMGVESKKYSAMTAMMSNSSRQQAAALTATNGRLNAQSKLIGSVKGSMMGFGASFVGVSAGVAVIGKLNEELERAGELLQEVEASRTKNISITDGTKQSAADMRKNERYISDNAGIPLSSG